MIVRQEPGAMNTIIDIDNSEFATMMARRICTIYVPEWMKTFIAKNRKYRKVTNNLGAKGVYPDVNRKVGILEARVWDGDPTSDGAESTVEVIDDLIGHLFLMRDMLIQEDKENIAGKWDGSVGRVMEIDSGGFQMSDAARRGAHSGGFHTRDLLPDRLAAMDHADDDD